MNIIGKRKIFYTISGLLITLSVVALILWGLEFGIEFKGGAILEIVYINLSRPEINSVYDSLKDLKLNDLRITPVGNDGLTLRFRETDETTHQNVITALTPPIEEKRFSSIGPTVGAELKQNSVRAIILVLLGISLYIAWAFRHVSRPISSWRYGVATLVALFHDLIIPIGLFAFLGRFYGIEIGTYFVVALLVILGFSVHDTIVVFDRIRENLKRYAHLDFPEIVNQSINETLVRSVSTSFTVLLTLFALFFFGGESLKYFVLTLLVGVFFGTYSSIFIASTLLVSWYSRLKLTPLR